MAQLQSTSITGSLIVTQGITGSFSGSITNAVSASYAATASYALNAGDSIWTGSAGNIYYNGGNVGIGTASPTEKLDVRGNLYAEGTNNHATFKATGGSYSYLELHDGASYGYLIKNVSAGTSNGALPGALYTYTDNNKAFQHIHAGSPLFTIQSDGNVGIGVTNPAYKLHVENNLNGGLLQALRNTNTGTSQYVEFKLGTSDSSELRLGSSYNYAASEWNQTWIYAVNRNLALKTSAGYDIRFYAGGTDDSYERMRVTNGGNVGIGTTSPAAKLDILGLVNTSIFRIRQSSGLLTQIESDNGYANLFLYQAGGNPQIGLVSNGSSYFNGGNVGIGTINPTAKLQIANPDAGSDGFQFQRWVYTAATAGVYELHLKQTVTSGVVRYNFSMINNSTAYNDVLVLDRGNVGIGTTSPGRKFVVTGAANDEWIATFTNTGTTPYGVYIDTSANSSTAYSFATYTNAGTGFFIRNNGNVGIGTTSPIYQFDITTANYKSFRIQSSDDALITIGSTVASSQFYSIGASGIGSGQGSNLFWIGRSTNNPSGLLTKDFVINSSGNVGIGTTSPSAKLHIGESGAAAQLWLQRTDGYNPVKLIGGTLADGNGFKITMNTTDAFSITSAGNVGIGTTSPNAKLEVANGFVRVGGTETDQYFFEGVRPGSSTTLRIYDNGSSVYYDSYSTMVFRANQNGGSSGNILLFGGNVGVGISPSVKLHVLSSGIAQRLESSATYTQLDFFNTTNTAANRNWAIGANLYNYGDFNIMASSAYNAAPNAAYTYLTINNAGNVGIGSINPGQKLQVEGSLLVNTGTSAAAYRDIMLGGIGGWSGGESHGIDTVYGSAGNPTTFSRIESHFDGTNGKIRFRNLFRASAPRTDILMTIQGDGNVGIGTDSPSNKLEVIGNIYTPNSIYLGSSGTYSKLGFYRYDGSAVGAMGWHTDDKFYIGGFPGWGATAGNEVRVYGFGANLYLGSTTAGDVVTVNTSGNVGIGTTSPASTLHVYNNADVWHTRIGGASGELRIGGQTASGAVIQALEPGGAIRQLYLQRDGGNVGIGTSSPTATLQINGGGGDTVPTLRLISTASDTFNWASSTQHANLTAGETSIHLIGKANSQYNQAYFGYRHVSDGSSSNMVTIGMYASDYLLNILGNGNVGIGVTNPSYKLHVNGNAYINETLYVNQATTIEDTLTVKTATGAYDVAVIDYSGVAGGRIKIYTDGILRSQIGSYYGDDTFFNAGYGGNVGIGTTSPTQKLSVQGNTDLGNSYGSTTSSTYTTRVSGYAMRYDASNRYGNYGVLILNADSGWTASARRFMITNGLNVNKFAIIRSVDSTTDPSFGDGGAISSGTADFVIDSAGNVGIGITTPNEKLHVAGNINAYVNGGIDAGLFASTSAGSTTIALRSNGITHFNGGSVGIGTTSPASLLHIYSTSGSPQGITIQGGDESFVKFLQGGGGVKNWGLITTNLAAGDFGIYQSTSVGGDPFSAGTAKMYFNNDGNVGIGTTSPTQLLHIVGTNAANNGLTLQNTNASGNSQVRFLNTSGTERAAITYVNGSDAVYHYTAAGGNLLNLVGGSIGIGTVAPASILHIYGSGNTFTRYTNTTYAGHYIDIGANSAGESFVYGYGAYPLLFGTNATERMRITSGGNVGIGTTSSTYRLAVVTSSSNGLYIQTSSSTFANPSIAMLNGSTDATISATSNGLEITTYSTHDMLFRTNTTERMRITSGGNVGIGTTSPASQFHLQGSNLMATFRNSSTSANQYTQLEFIAGSRDAYIWLGNQNTTNWAGDGGLNIYTGTGNMDFWTAATQRMRITAGGNVGIGTTSPATKLHVVGDQILDDGTNGRLTFSLESGENNVYSTTTGFGSYKPLRFTSSEYTYRIGGTEIMRITNSGNVGIGTTSPTAKLNVIGNIRVSDGTDQGYVYFRQDRDDVYIGENSGYQLTMGAPSGVIIETDSNTNGFSLFNVTRQAVSQFYIGDNGNVGINVATPQAKLQVSGSSNVLNVRGSGSAATSSIFSVDGNNGRLFEVSDDLSNSLFSVNTIAGLPVIEAFADYTVTMGTYGAYTLQVTGSRVGVGTSSPGYPLHVSGSVSGISIYATNDIAAFSDQSVKTDLQVIDSAIDRIKQINGYTYVRVDDLSNTRRAGVIAQEVQKVLPEVVSENTDGTLNVAYSNMIALLIEGMKEQQIQIDKLREDLEDLRYEL